MKTFCILFLFALCATATRAMDPPLLGSPPHDGTRTDRVSLPIEEPHRQPITTTPPPVNTGTRTETDTPPPTQPQEAPRLQNPELPDINQVKTPKHVGHKRKTKTTPSEGGASASDEARSSEQQFSKETYNMSLIDYVNHLSETHTFDELLEHFKILGFSIKTMIPLETEERHIIFFSGHKKSKSTPSLPTWIIEAPGAILQRHTESTWTNCDLSLIEFFNRLAITMSLPEVIKYFQGCGFDVSTPQLVKATPYEGNLFHIRYQEKVRLWRHRWAMEARGVIIRRIADNTWILDRYLAPRFPEGCIPDGQVHETDDMISRDDIEHFSEDHQQILKTLSLMEQQITADASTKLDGFLACVSFYDRGTEQGIFYEHFITRYGTDLSRKVLEKCTRENFILVIGTLGTLCVDSTIEGDLVQAIILGEKKTQEHLDAEHLEHAEHLDAKHLEHAEHLDAQQISHNDFAKEAMLNSPSEMFEKYGDTFVNNLAKWYKHVKKNYPTLNHTTVMLEVILAGRKGLFPGASTHLECAVSSNTTSLTFLGASIHTEDPYCNMFVSYLDMRQPFFHEPLSWKLSSVEVLKQLLGFISGCLYDDSQLPEGLSLEGLVVRFILPNGNLCFLKFKIPEYYLVTKPRNTISDLVTLNTLSGNRFACTVFPFLCVFKMFNDQLELRLGLVCSAIKAGLVFDPSDPKSNAMIAGMSDKALVTFRTKEPITRAKMMLNTDNGQELIFASVRKQFPIPPTIQGKKAARELVTILEPWREDLTQSMQILKQYNMHKGKPDVKEALEKVKVSEKEDPKLPYHMGFHPIIASLFNQCLLVVPDCRPSLPVLLAVPDCQPSPSVFVSSP